MTDDLKVINAPERIYLQIGDDFDPGEVDFSALQDVTWCADNIHGTDIAYVRAEDLAAAHFRIAELEAKCRLYEASLDKSDGRIAELEAHIAAVDGWRKDADAAYETLAAIGDYAHARSTGPAVPDALWEVRRMAYEAVYPAIDAALAQQEKP
jgi:hypothetical protein